MCDSTGDACGELSVCIFMEHTHQNAHMHHKFASVCLCVSVSMCDRTSSGWGRPLINVDLSL